MWIIVPWLPFAHSAPVHTRRIFLLGLATGFSLHRPSLKLGHDADKGLKRSCPPVCWSVGALLI